jgi:integrase/recombinase XerD
VNGRQGELFSPALLAAPRPTPTHRATRPHSGETPNRAAPTSTSCVIDGNHAVDLYLASLAPSSRVSVEQSLLAVTQLLTGARLDPGLVPWTTLRHEHTQKLRAALVERFAPATAARHLAAVRGVLRQAWRMGLMRHEDYRRALDVRPIRVGEHAAGRALSGEELAALFAACGSGPKGVRDAALLAVLYQGNARRSEVVALDVADLDAGSGALVIRRGKGGVARTVYLEGGGLEAMARWLALRGNAPGPLFGEVRKGGRVVVRRLTDQFVRHTVERLATKASIAPVSPHDFRRTCITDLLERGVDVLVVQRLVGHADLRTTARYDRRGEGAKRAAAGRLHIGFAERPR